MFVHRFVILGSIDKGLIFLAMVQAMLNLSHEERAEVTVHFGFVSSASGRKTMAGIGSTFV